MHSLLKKKDAHRYEGWIKLLVLDDHLLSWHGLDVQLDSQTTENMAEK